MSTDKKKSSWGIASALSESGVTLETFEVEVEGPTMEEMERIRREENDAEYARLMEIRKMMEENPDWVGQLEKEIRSDEDSDVEQNEEEEEDEKEEKKEEEQQPRKKKRRRRRKKKSEDDATLSSEPKDAEPIAEPVVTEPRIVEKKKDQKKNKKTAAVPKIDDPKRTIYVGNLSYDADVSSIKEGLKCVGAVDQVHVIKNNKGRGAGFAYVTFKDEDTAKKAICSETPISIDGRDIRVKTFDPESLYRRNGKRKAKRKRNI
eukprot:g3756.t1